MKRKSSKYLEFYKECLETGLVAKNQYGARSGMCLLFKGDESFELMKPSNSEKYSLMEKGFHNAYWAAGIPRNEIGVQNAFTPLRQTIVLFMHEMTVNPIEE